MMEEFKRKVDLAVEVIESCFDENNPNDNLSFDERLQRKIDGCEDEVVRGILNDAKNFWFRFLITKKFFVQEFENMLHSINFLYEYRVSISGWHIKKCCMYRMYKDMHQCTKMCIDV